MRRRLVLAANAVPQLGGAGLNLHHMIEALRTEFDLTVFCRENGASAGHAVSEASLAKVIRKVPVLRRRRDWLTLISETHFDRYVCRRLPEADFFQGVAGQCAESMARARYLGCGTMLDVVTAHVDEFYTESNIECAKFGVSASGHSRLRERILKEYQVARVMRVMSRYALETFLERGFRKEQFLVAMPPFDLDEFPTADFSQPAFRVSFVGLIEPWKGFHYLIEAFRRLNVRDAELILWGGSSSRPVARYLTEQKLREPRLMVRTVDVRRYGYGNVYGQSSVLVHPSLTDGFAYVVGEAMASGIPVIATSKTGASELIVDGENGYIVPPRDSEAIRDRLQHLADSPSLLRKMGKAARETVRNLTMDSFRSRLVSAYSTMLIRSK